LKLEDCEDIRDEIESSRDEKREYDLTTYRSQAERATEVENWSEAEKAWSAYLALNPKDADRIESELSHARRYARISVEYNRAREAMNKKRYGKAIELLQGIIAQDPSYKSTSRLLVEAVETNKATPVWRRPWLYWVAGVLVIVIVGVLFRPWLLSTFSTAPKETPIVEGLANETPIPGVPTETITPFATEGSPTLESLDQVDSETEVKAEITPSPTVDPRVLNPDNQHLYRWFGDRTAPSGRSWGSARDYCEAVGGYLVTIQDAAENEFVFELSDGFYSWLGATDEEQEGTWVWVTGESWVYENWDSGEPLSGSDFNYLAHTISSKWTASNHSASNDFICEWDPESTGGENDR
jgi:tetratricopeptide (TPR) repeat protein